MIFLQKETRVFEHTGKLFWREYLSLLDLCRLVADERGKYLDKATPVHHRLSPGAMVHETTKKSGRIRTILGQDDWSIDRNSLEKIREEAVDGANYFLYLASLCGMLLDELREEGQ